MRIPTFLFLTASLLGGFGSCDTKFISPPDGRDEEGKPRDPGENRRYFVGETIPLKWETDIDDIVLMLVQRFQYRELNNVHEFQGSSLDATRTSWEAKYDEAEQLKNGEDSLYFFAIYEPGTRSPVASSVYFNVTAPKDDIKTVTAPPSTVTISHSRYLDIERTSTASNTTPEETTSTSEQQENDSTSGMSQGEMAGAAVGGVVGGLLIFGAIGWVLWRRIARRKSRAVNPTTVQYQEQGVETKAELPGDNSVHPSEYAKSPTGIYEAP